MIAIDITKEPRDETYRTLIDYLGSRCSIFSLVWREQLSFDESARLIANQLQPFLIREERTNEWPGTRLFESMAMVRYYRSTQDSLALLKNQISLFGWLASDLPEDLAFYDESETCAFASISHEKDAWFNGSVFNAEDIKTKIPGIDIRRTGV
jgi:hypothetical protein